MEIKEAERVVIAKPIASRPTPSKFRSFSELLAGAIDSSAPDISSETAVAAIRPKTLRFKSMVSRAPAASPSSSSQAEFLGTGECRSSDIDSRSETIGTIIYKPRAKLVSRTTVTLLANMGNFNATQQQALPSAEVSFERRNQETCNLTSQDSSDLHQNIPPGVEAHQMPELSRSAAQNQDEDPKVILPAANNGDRPSYDGYNWRKYGQKQVKGSEYPRSYYKCTHPNCPVKKKVERSFDGQIAEIVYQGEHNHAKPLPPKRNTSGTQGLGVVSDSTGDWWSNNHLNERNEDLECRVENQNGLGLPSHSILQDKTPPQYAPASAGSILAVAGTSDTSCGPTGEFDEGSKGFDRDDDAPRSKRRKCESKINETAIAGARASRESNVVVQSSTDTGLLGDGFRWRKYGQKVVKGNPYPRSYYRCTSVKCNVRKYVERTSDDPKAYITTYEGKHNHDMPLRSTPLSAALLPADLQAPPK